jgi:hypothetical protein
MDLSKYRALKYGHRLVTDRVIICDEPLSRSSRGKIHNLQTLDGSGFTLLNDFRLGETLEVLLREALQGAVNALIVFPGDGALYARRRSWILTRFTCVEVPAGRLWTPGSEPVAFAGTILPEKFLHLVPELIIVVDDVISSGATMLALHRRNAWRFPKARWLAATWILQKPRSKAPSGLSGYDAVPGDMSCPSQTADDLPSTLCPRSAANLRWRIHTRRDILLKVIGRNSCSVSKTSEGRVLYPPLCLFHRAKAFLVDV